MKNFIIYVVFLFAGVFGVLSISRDEVLERARRWINRPGGPVPYSQKEYETDYSTTNPKSYRTDCSGYVSMAWRLPRSRETDDLGQVAHEISKNDLKPGDILLKPKVESKDGKSVNKRGHTLIFERWVNKAKGSYMALEMNSPHVKNTFIKSYPYKGLSGYKAYRYNNITD